MSASVLGLIKIKSNEVVQFLDNKKPEKKLFYLLVLEKNKNRYIYINIIINKYRTKIKSLYPTICSSW